MDFFDQVVSKFKSIPTILIEPPKVNNKTPQNPVSNEPDIQNPNTLQVKDTTKPRSRTGSPFSSPFLRRKKRDGKHSRNNSGDWKDLHKTPLSPNSPLRSVKTNENEQSAGITEQNAALPLSKSTGSLASPRVKEIRKHQRRNSSSETTSDKSTHRKATKSLLPRKNDAHEVTVESVTSALAVISVSSPQTDSVETEMVELSSKSHINVSTEQEETKKKRRKKSSKTEKKERKEKKEKKKGSKHKRGASLDDSASKSKHSYRTKERLQCNQLSIRGQVWLLRTRSTIEQFPERQNIAYKSIYSKELPHEYEEQIIKDLHRTYPQYKLFAKKETQDIMFRILKAIAIHKYEIGYCQGMGYVAGFLLTLMPEEDVFWMMCQLIDHYGMAELWKPGLPGIKKCYFIIEGLIQCALPRLWKHFREEGMDTSMYSTSWIMTLFLYNHTFAFSQRLWDLFLFEGFYSVFLLVLSLLTLYEDQLLKLDFENMLPFLQFSSKKHGFEPPVEEVLKIANTIRDTVECSVRLFESEFEQTAAKVASSN